MDSVPAIPPVEEKHLTVIVCCASVGLHVCFPILHIQNFVQVNLSHFFTQGCHFICK